MSSSLIFCDCFTDTSYGGDRAACEEAQFTSDEIVPPTCVVEAFEAHPEAAIDYLICYAAVIERQGDCFAVCPEGSAAQGCNDTAITEFADCRAVRDADLSADIAACN